MRVHREGIYKPAQYLFQTLDLLLMYKVCTTAAAYLYDQPTWLQTAIGWAVGLALYTGLHSV